MLHFIPLRSARAEVALAATERPCYFNNMQSPLSVWSSGLFRLLRAGLRWGPVRTVRRNHALEHATVHILQEKNRSLRLSGYSTERGFVLFGDIPSGATEQAAQEALKRLRAGQHQLAIHPQCGTNYVIQGLLCTVVGYLGFAGISRTRALARLNLVSTLMLLAMLASPTLGMTAQAHITTDGDVGLLEILSVERRQLNLPFLGILTLHQVRTGNG